MTALPPKHKAAFLPTWRLHSWIVLFVLLFPASRTYNKHMKLCAVHAWLPNTFWLSDFHKVCVCVCVHACVCVHVCVHLHQLCQFSDEKSAPSAVLSVCTEERGGTPHYRRPFLPAPASGISPGSVRQSRPINKQHIWFSMRNTLSQAPPHSTKRHEIRGVWSGQNNSEESGRVGDVSRRPAASNMLLVGENVELRTWGSPAQAPQVSRELQTTNPAVTFNFPRHSMNCLPPKNRTEAQTATDQRIWCQQIWKKMKNQQVDPELHESGGTLERSFFTPLLSHLETFIYVLTHVKNIPRDFLLQERKTRQPEQ